MPSLSPFDLAPVPIRHDFPLLHNICIESFDTHIFFQLSSLSPRCRMLSPSTSLLADISVPEYSDAYFSCTDIIPSRLTHSPFHPSIQHLRDIAGIGLVDELRWELWSTTRCHPSSHGPSFSAVCGSASVSVHIASSFLCVAAFSSFLSPLYFLIAVIFSFFFFFFGRPSLSHSQLLSPALVESRGPVVKFPHVLSSQPQLLLPTSPSHFYGPTTI
jgi:hypothetical protein